MTTRFPCGCDAPALQTLYHICIYIAIAVDEVTEELVFLDGFEMLVGNVDTARSRGVGLNLVHNGIVAIFLYMLFSVAAE